jgi:hypothetical protein
MLAVLAPALVQEPEPDGRRLYLAACSACHGDDGRGRPQRDVGFETPLPDFGDCEFASREPDPDWHAVIHQGGPVRAFDRMMPAFGQALGAAEIAAILRHVRSFCADASWPRGEFNLPRPLFTEKAFPEDEAVVTADLGTGDETDHEVELLYERRIGSRHMIEVALPFVGRSRTAGGGASGLGDVALGYKYAAYHDLDSGHIVSLGGEVILPTGDQEQGLGSGATLLEPFVTWGWLLGAAFLQAHAFAEVPVEGDREHEAGLRMAFGRTWTSGGPFGRSWTPTLEVLAQRELESGAAIEVDLVPQIQVSLNRRQHLLLSVGARIPLVHGDDRDVRIVAYVLWDWFDGRLFDGW